MGLPLFMVRSKETPDAWQNPRDHRCSNFTSPPSGPLGIGTSPLGIGTSYGPHATEEGPRVFFLPKTQDHLFFEPSIYSGIHLNYNVRYDDSYKIRHILQIFYLNNDIKYMACVLADKTKCSTYYFLIFS